MAILVQSESVKDTCPQDKIQGIDRKVNINNVEYLFIPATSDYYQKTQDSLKVDCLRLSVATFIKKAEFF